MPPMPMAAMFILLLGACAPNTEPGTMAAESAPIAAVAANWRRETVGMLSSIMAVLPRGRTGTRAPTGALAPCYRTRRPAGHCA